MNESISISAVSANDVVKYLEKAAPELAALMRKNMTASDVHATTALGNEKGSKKISFAEGLAARKAKGKKADDKPVTKIDESAEWEVPLEILKSEPDQQLVFGWASVASIKGELVIDKQGDIILPEDLEKASYDFVMNCRSQGDMHRMGDDGKPVQVGHLVASWPFTKQMQDMLGIDLGMEGWLVGFKVQDDAVWSGIKSGKLPEFSIGGRGKRVAVG